jgi:hypothetical protein
MQRIYSLRLVDLHNFTRTPLFERPKNVNIKVTERDYRIFNGKTE